MSEWRYLHPLKTLAEDLSTPAFKGRAPPVTVSWASVTTAGQPLLTQSIASPS